MFFLLPRELWIPFLLTVVIALTVHEFAHAWSAYELGDTTAKDAGRLTLNPLKHLDPIGTLLILMAGFGYAKPVPFNPYAVTGRTSAGVMLVAAAGPASNLLLAILASIPFLTGLLNAPEMIGCQVVSGTSLLMFSLVLFIILNLNLLVFNLLPIFPLDGEKVLTYFLPPGGQAAMIKFRRYGPMVLFALIAIGRFGGVSVLGTVIGVPVDFLCGLLIP